MIRAATVNDAEALARIYNHYIRETMVTFEEEPLSEPEMASRIVEVVGASLQSCPLQRGRLQIRQLD